MKKTVKEIQNLRKENEFLRKELKRIQTNINLKPIGKTVSAPDNIAPIFLKAQKTVGKYFENLVINPEKGMIEVGGQRYLLVRASALSYDFMNTFKNLYADRGEKEAVTIANNFLFDIAHVIGIEDGKNFHKRMHLKDPIEKLAAGPVHFAFTGWAYVEILPESHPSANKNFFLKFHHPFSFEADSWIRAGKKSQTPVCIMNSGYSSGWCEESFGIPLTAVEISCRAKGDAHCTFIMAPPDKIEEYLGKEKSLKKVQKMAVPSFMERKKIEEELRISLQEKEILLREIHHRVKNNLQVISSLLNLQSNTFSDSKQKGKFQESINRIKSMAIIHELLYRAGDLSKISISEYFNALVNFISDSYAINTKIKYDVQIKTKSKTIDIDKGIPCGLILNELLSNTLKYAFKSQKSGKIFVSFSEVVLKGKNYFELVVKDNGIGFPKKIDLENPESFGLQIINSLVSQLSGTMKVESKMGTTFTILF